MNDTEQAVRTDEAPPATRKPYAEPQLVVYGDLPRLTQGSIDGDRLDGIAGSYSF